MNDERDKGGAGKDCGQAQEDQSAYDDFVALAISNAEWIAHLCSAPLQPDASEIRWGTATCSILVLAPSARLLWSLIRLERIAGRRGRAYLLFRPTAASTPAALQDWCITILSVLHQHLGGEARFEGHIHIAGDRKRTPRPRRAP